MNTLYSEPDRHDYLDRSISDLHHRLIVESVLRRCGIEKGTCVVEIGAGAGRYTSLLVQQGLRVLAIEPDTKLAEKLRARHAADDRIRVEVAYPYDERIFPADAVAVCGFHVLHHMDAVALQRLSAVLLELSRSRPGFRGWFFLEPNPFNPLYLLQIALRPSMRFREEKGIWTNRYDEAIGRGTEATLGYAGYWPPGLAIARAPEGVQRLGTRLSSWPSPFFAYALIGHVCGPPGTDAVSETRTGCR